MHPQKRNNYWHNNATSYLYPGFIAQSYTVSHLHPDAYGEEIISARTWHHASFFPLAKYLSGTSQFNRE